MAAAVVILLAACQQSPPFKATELKGGADFGGDFALTAHDGRRINTADYRGKVQIVFFGYAHCPDICAPTLARIAQAVKALGDDAGKVQVLFVTVDPKHDSPKQLADFVPKFNASFLGLTGTEAEIARVAADHKVAYAQRPDDPNFVDHFGGILVKDVKGRLRLVMKNDTAPADIEHDLRLLMKEPG
jgi:protein SCO1/2